MQAKSLNYNDFREVKAMLKAGWDRATIIRRSGWSEKTVQRIANAKQFKDYKDRIFRDTSRFKDLRRQHTDVAGSQLGGALGTGYMTGGDTKPAPALNPPKGSILKQALNKLGGRIWRK